MKEWLELGGEITSPISASTSLLVIAVGVFILTAIVIALAIVVFLHHIVSDRNRRRNRERFESAASFLAPFLVANDRHLGTQVHQARARFGDRAVSLVLRRSRYDIRGEGAETITAVLTEMGAVSKLMHEAKSRRDWKRAIAIRGLGECGGEEARGALMAASKDVAGEVRRAAREGLLSDGSPEAIQAAIASFLEDLPRRAGWRKSFYARLASIAPPRLIELVQSGDLQPGEEKLALEALGDTDSKEALPLGLQRMTSEDPEMRATAVRVVGKLGDQEHVPMITEFLADPAWFVRAAGARALEWMLGPRGIAKSNPSLAGPALEALSRSLVDTSWWVRANAARALSFGGRRGTDLLFESSEGVDAYARDASLAALAMAELTPDDRGRLEGVVARLMAAKPVETKKPGLVLDLGLQPSA